MGRFWESATEQAGREFGARHYRWFAGARVARKASPVGLTLFALGGLVVGVVVGYRWLSPDWPAIGSRLAGWSAAAGGVLFWALVAAAGLSVVAVAVAVVRRNWWRWSLYRPMWMRRY